ncbi:MAG: DNA cytosine methyltransferase [Eubacteriales bacterium]|nr:DNA cytosine methyltransferase [Eubacteriales bacterium]
MKGQLNIFDELIIDNFAGGGGASCGIELATGRPVDIAINHDPDAIAMHKANHPYTRHYQESVWDINPKEICQGHKVGLAWFSPDCKHFSKAKGGKPVDKNIRGLAWIVLKWAGTVRPRVIILENVEEFQTWGPVRKGKPVKSKQGQTFERWKNQLSALGYEIEHRELRACDYGAPTIRKRFFLIARCDGLPIVWPKQTHASADDERVKSGELLPYKSAAECIDFNIPCQSIFNRSKPLVKNTQRRIARGLDKFVIKSQDPFIVPIGYGEKKGQPQRVQDIKKPLSTIVSSCKQYLCLPYITKFQQNSRGQSITAPLDTVMAGATRFALMAPSLIQYHSETAKSEVRGQQLNQPIYTIDGSPRYALFTPYLSKYFGGVVGSKIDKPLPTVTAIDHNSLTMPYLTQYYGGADHANSVLNPLQTVTVKPRHFLCESYLTILRKNMVCKAINEPLPTITAHANHFAKTDVYLKEYDGDNLGHWSEIRELLNTYTDWNISANQVLIFLINGVEYFISDIGLRMLQPKELYKAQGFPDDYIIDKDCNGKEYKKTKQVARCGNAVPPPFSKALVMANCKWLCDKSCNNMKEFNAVAAG